MTSDGHEIPDLLAEATRAHESGRLREAQELYQRILSLHPDHPHALHLLGVLYHQTGRNREAVELLERAIALDPNSAAARCNLGTVFAEMGRPADAIDEFRTALLLHPQFPEALANLGNALKDNGELDEAIQCYRQSLALRADARVGSNLLVALNYHPDYGPRQIRQEHAIWNQTYARKLLTTIRLHENSPQADRRLRVGYVSPHFRDVTLLLPLLRHRNRSDFEVFCYSGAGPPDSPTQLIASQADTWRITAGIPDEGLAQTVRLDRIDILVDLALHSNGGRPLLFARKPAPVQITWLAYPGTSGLEMMDYRLSDRYIDPEGCDEGVYSEKTIRLPHCFWCFDPIVEQPEVNPLPALTAGFVTFGSLNAFCKVTARTLKLWSLVMRLVPNSRMLILAPPGPARQRTLDAIGADGVDPSRLRFVDRLPRDRYLALHHQIDLNLDTLPCPGHSTMLDSLWMGVPVVTLAGDTAVSRGGASILSNVGLTDLIAADPRHYCRIAPELARDVTRLAELRTNLRQRMRASPVMDGPRFATEVESIYRLLWQRSRENYTDVGKQFSRP